MTWQSLLLLFIFCYSCTRATYYNDYGPPQGYWPNQGYAYGNDRHQSYPGPAYNNYQKPYYGSNFDDPRRRPANSASYNPYPNDYNRQKVTTALNNGPIPNQNVPTRGRQSNPNDRQKVTAAPNNGRIPNQNVSRRGRQGTPKSVAVPTAVTKTPIAGNSSGGSEHVARTFELGS